MSKNWYLGEHAAHEPQTKAAAHREDVAGFNGVHATPCSWCSYIGKHRGYDPTVTPGEAWYGVKP